MVTGDGGHDVYPGSGPLYGVPNGGVLLLVGVGFPPSLVGVGEEGRGREGEGKGGRLPTPIRIGLGGGAPRGVGCAPTLVARVWVSVSKPADLG